MKSKRLTYGLLVILFLLAAISCVKEEKTEVQNEELPYLKIAEDIRDKGLTELGAFTFLEHITSVGHRLPGSPQAAEAVKKMRQEMEELGFDNVHLEPTEVPHWVRGTAEEAQIISSINETIPISVCAIGGSISTPQSGIKAQVLEVQNFQELKDAAENAKGKIVFFNRPMDPTLINTFSAYGGTASQRTRGAIEAAKVGAAAVLVRSLTTKVDDNPHTGVMAYDSNVKRIPAACISLKGAILLSERLQKDPSLKVYLKLSCKNLEPVTSYNVIGQITGTEKPNEIILLGGHLDCWDFGTGAHDDGAGCAQTMEALRLIKEMGLRPKRTIRGVLYMNEEFGGGGGRDYVKSEKRKKEKHLVAMESDRGGFLPVGIGVGGGSEFLNRIQSWKYLFEPAGIYWIRTGGGGVDIGPLAEFGTILSGLIPDSQRYFDVHHSANDVIEAVNPRELELGAIVMATFAYVLAEEGI